MKQLKKIINNIVDTAINRGVNYEEKTFSTVLPFRLWWNGLPSTDYLNWQNNCLHNYKLSMNFHTGSKGRGNKRYNFA